MASRIKGITVEIGAETTGLEKALKDVNKSSRDIQKELREVDKLLKFNPKNTDLLKQKQKLLGDQVSVTREKLDKLKAAEKQVQEQFKKGDIKEDQYRAFQREVVETESKLKHYENQLKDVSAAQNTFKQRIDATAQSLKSAGAKMTSAGKGLTVGVTGPIVAAGAGMLSLATKSGQAADRLLDLKEITGLSTDSLQEWAHVATVAGVDSEAMSAAVEGLVRKMPGLKKETGPATEALEEMGLTFEQLESLSPDEQFDTLINYLSEMEDPLKRNALGSQLFGGAWKEIAPVLGMGADGIKEAREEAHELGRVLSEESLNDANDFRVELDKLKGMVQSTAQQIGADLAPMLRDTLGPIVKDTVIPAMKGMADAVKSGVEWFGKLSPGTQETILKVAGLAAAIGPVLIVFGKLTSAVGSIIGLFGGAGAVGGGLAAAFAAITGPIGLAVAAVAGLVAIGVTLYKNWDTIKEKASEFKDKVGETWDGIKEKTSETWNSMKENVSKTWDSVTDKTSKTWDKVKENTATAWGLIKNKVDENGGGIEGALKTYTGIYESVWKFGLDTLDKVTGGKFTDIREGIKNKLEDTKKSIADAVKRFVDLFKFDWSLPKPKIPKFSITGEFSLMPPSIPKIGIDWNAEGAIFTKPYVFGNQGFGEAGPEAVLPIEKLGSILADTLNRMGGGQSGTVRHDHSGTIRFEGVNDQGQMVGVVDAVMQQLRREARTR